MEVRVRERLIGALVLVAIVVLLVPAILTGRAPAPAQVPGPQSRRVEVPVGDEAPAPEEQQFVPEPALPGATPPGGPAAAAPAPAMKSPPTQAAPAGAGGTRAALSQAKPAATPPPPSAATPVPQAASAWAVQLGAFSNRAKADQFVAELKKRRYAAFVLEYRAAGQVLYRVRVGPEQDRARAEEIAARLAKDGYQPVVARHP